MGVDEAGIVPAFVERANVLETLVAGRTVQLGCRISGFAALAFGALYAYRGPVIFAAPNLAAGVVLTVVSVLPFRRVATVIYIAVAVAALLLGYQLLLLGRIDNGIATWFLVPFLAAVIVGERRLAVITAICTALELFGVVVAGRLGLLVPRADLPDTDVVMAGSIVAVMGLCGFFGYLSHRSRRALVAALEARHSALERSLVETEQARAEAIAASSAKERFFANLTHEIRTPLTVIAGTAELLEHTPLTTEQVPLARALRTSTENLTELVNAMLDHAKVRAGHITVVPSIVDVKSFAADLLKLYAARAADKGLTLEVRVGEVPRFVETDGVKLRQIVVNLLSNAIKFTRTGRVDVRIAAVEGRLRVAVTDTGPGVAPDALARIFEPFEQGDTSIVRAYGGTGLGLTIARDLARLLDGDIRVESAPGRGATFTLDLPLVERSAPLVTTNPAVGEGLQGLDVLLAEDNAVNRMVARGLLEHLGARVTEAADGLEAVAEQRATAHAVVLMDLQMPQLDGISAARQIRALEEEQGRAPAAIVAMTGNSSDDYAAVCFEAGMSGFVTKPVSLEQLRVTLLEVVHKSSGRVGAA